jgi:diphthamide synthase subunit DPH2
MLSRSCKFVPAALKVIIEAIVLGCTQIPCDQVLQFAMLVAGPQELQDRWSKKTVAGLSKLP